MKKFLLLSAFFLVSQWGLSQQELLDHEWILHYIEVDGVTTNVPQPSAQNPGYQPGINFFEDGSGLNATAIITFNNWFNLEPIIATADQFTVPLGAVTLGTASACVILKPIIWAPFFWEVEATEPSITKSLRTEETTL